MIRGRLAGLARGWGDWPRPTGGRRLPARRAARPAAADLRDRAQPERVAGRLLRGEHADRRVGPRRPVGRDRNWSSSPPPRPIGSPRSSASSRDSPRVAPLALAGAGATQRMADDIGARLLSGDPVTAAQHQGQEPLERCSAPTGRPAVLWFRRDLRLDDHPALVAAARQGPVVPLFVFDDALLRTAGRPRLAYLLQTLRALDRQLEDVWRSTHTPARPTRTGRTGGGRRDRCVRRPHLHRLRPVWRPARPARRRRARRGAAGSDRISLRRRPRPDPQAEWRAVPGVHARSIGRGSPTAGAPPPGFDPSAVEWRTIGGEAIPDDPPITATLPTRARPPHVARGQRFRERWAGGATATGATTQPSTAPRACRRSSNSARSIHARCSTISDRTTTASAASWHGGSSTPPCSTTCPPPLGSPSNRTWSAWSTTVVPIADLGFRCVGSGRTGYPLVDAGMRQLLEKAGCTTGCG